MCLYWTLILVAISFIIAGISVLDTDSGLGLTTISIGAVLSGLIAVFTFGYLQNKEKMKDKEAVDHKWIDELVDLVYEERLFADYITGLKNYEGSMKNIGYVVTNEDYIFYKPDDFQSITEFSRDSLSSYDIMDNTQFTEKFDFGALVVMGPLGISQQKTEKHELYYLKVDFEDGDDRTSTLIFRHHDPKFFDKFLSFKESFVKKPRSDEKKCKYCAEIIKAEAVVCRYCGRDL